MNKHLRLPLAVAGVLLAAACGGEGATGDERAAASLPDDACAQLDATTLIDGALGGEATVLSDSVTEAEGKTRAQCVWSTTAPDISLEGATVELVIESAPRSDLDELFETAASLDTAPAEWHPTTRIETTAANPKGQWEQAQGSDYKHPIAGAGAMRQLSFRAVEGEDFVARIAVRMDGQGGGSPAPAKLANQLLGKVPALFD